MTKAETWKAVYNTAVRKVWVQKEMEGDY